MAESKKRFWFGLHGWLSLPIWFLFSFICLTGTISVISHELTWLTNKASRATNPNNVQKIPLYEQVDAVTKRFPDATITRIMVLEPYLVTAVGFTNSGNPSAIAYVNPYSGEIQEVNNGITFIGFMRSLHGWLLFPWQHRYSIGYYLVSLLSFVVLGALISGIKVYRKFWHSYKSPRVRISGGSRALLGDLHRLLGAWSIWFLLVIGITSSWYLVQAVLFHNAIKISDEPEDIPVSAATSIQNKKPLKDILEIASNQFKHFEPSYVSAPEHNLAYWTIAGSGNQIFYDEYSNRALVNPWDGAVAKTEQPSTMNLVEKVSHLADPLHYGRFGGMTTKIIWFFFGIALTALSLSGCIIWFKRGAISQGPWFKRWMYIINPVIILAPIWFAYSQMSPPQVTDLGIKEGGGFKIEVSQARDSSSYPEKNGWLRDLAFRFIDGTESMMKIGYANIGAAPSTSEHSNHSEGVIHGYGATQGAHVPSPKNLSSKDKLWVRLVGWNGEQVLLSWDIR